MELFAADGHDAGGCERVTGKSGMRPLAHCSAVYPDSTLATCAATVNRNPIVSVDHETEGRRAFGFARRDPTEP